MKTKPFLVGLLLVAGLLRAQAAQFGDFQYESSDRAVTITGYTGPGGAVTIPDEIEGLPVTSIGVRWTQAGWFSGAFEGCEDVSSVLIPNRITSIGQRAFQDCTSLTSVAIPDSVTEIGDYAFNGCTGLTSATVGNGLPRVSARMFSECTSLTTVVIGTSVTTIDGGFLNDGVKGFWLGAFCGCSALTNVTILGNLATIADGAFKDCNSLTGITIPRSVTSIGDSAFRFCTGLMSITIPNSVTDIGGWAFYGCISLSTVTIGNGVTNIGDVAFSGCTGLTSAYFEANAPSLGSGALSGTPATAYYLPGTTGWDRTYGGRPTAPWVRPDPVILDFGPSFGVQPNGFGFVVSWATNANVVVEACTDLAQPVWSLVNTNTLTSGTATFTGPDWTQYPARFYRVRGE